MCTIVFSLEFDRYLVVFILKRLSLLLLVAEFCCVLEIQFHNNGPFPLQLHCGATTAPFYFCNNFFKTYYSEIIMGTYILQ